MKKSTIIKVTLALTLCLLTLILCHFCTHDVRVNFSQDSNRYIYEFAYLDGEYKTEVNLAEGKNIDIVIVKSKKGAQEGVITKNLYIKDKKDQYTKEFLELYK
mgnify:CR=1 FL=1